MATETSVELIWETFAETGTPPITSVITARHDPPTYPNIVAQSDTVRTIAAAAVHTAVVIPNCCAMLLLSDEPVGVKIGGTSELEHITRVLLFQGTDETAIAFPTASIYLSGKGALANVRILYLETVA